MIKPSDGQSSAEPPDRARGHRAGSLACSTHGGAVVVIRGLAPDRALEPVLIAAAWWLSNGLLVGIMAALAQGRTARDGLRLGITQEGWLRLQEGALSVLAVVAWWTNPLLPLVIVLLV